MPPYQRPPLSKAYLKGEMAPRAAAAAAAELLRGRGDRARDRRAAVAAIDRAARALALADGRRLAYDLLALTTGSLPRRLPAAQGGGLDGVLLMRDLADADALAGGDRARGRGR